MRRKLSEGVIEQSKKKLRVFVQVGEEKLVVPIESDLTIQQATHTIQNQLDKKSKQLKVTHLKIHNALLSSDDLVQDVLKEDETVVVETEPSKPGDPAPLVPLPIQSAPWESAGAGDSDGGRKGNAPALPPLEVNLPAVVPPPQETKSDGPKETLQLTCHPVIGTPCTLEVASTLPISQLRTKMNEIFKISSWVCDLHFENYPLLVTNEKSMSPLGEWGFQGNQRVYVNFRPTLPNTDEYFNATKQHNYQLVPAWQPIQKEQTQKGMACFLSSLWVFTANLSIPAKTLGHLSRLIQFPPAVLSIYYLSQKKTIYNEQKSALSNALFTCFQKIIRLEESKLNQLFEYSSLCFGYLQAFADADDEQCVSFTQVPLTCDSSYTRIKDPCYINNNKDKMYSKDNITPEMKATEITPAIEIQKYLLAHPIQSSIFIVNTKITSPKEPISLGAVELMSKVYKAVPFMKLVPTLSLPTAKSPSITLNADKIVTVYAGPEPCSVNTHRLFNPLTGATQEIDPGALAKALGSGHESSYELEDDREIKEVIMVCFDKSGSMGGTCFPDMIKPSETPEKKYSIAELATLLTTLKQHPRINIFRSIFKRYPNLRKEVIEEISNLNEGFKQLSKTSSFLEVMNQKPDVDVKFIGDENEEEKLKPEIPKEGGTQIFVRSVNGKTKVLNVELSFTIRELKVLLNHKWERDLNTGVRLVFAGKHLEDEKTLSSYNIKKESTLWDDIAPTNSILELQVLDRLSGRTIYLKVPTKIITSIEAFQDYIWPKVIHPPSSYSVWVDMVNSGDRIWQGTKIKTFNLYRLTNSTKIEFFSRNQKKKDKSLFNRLQTTKELFHALINRMQAYHYPTNIGLILFGTNVEEVCPITPLFEVFRDHIDSVSASGDTALYDAIEKAADALEQYKTKKKGFRARIFCLSDGADTCSKIPPWKLAQKLQQKEIVLDVIMIGEGTNNQTLKGIAKATGGYAFAPTTLKSALKINELETLLSILERPPVTRGTIGFSWDFSKFTNLPLDICSDEVVPNRQLPELIQKPVVPLETSFETQSKSDIVRSREREILFQMKKLIQEPHPSIDIYPCESDISFWRMIIEGPSETPYENGVWLVYLLFPAGYPSEAPEVRFVTPIRHCNVNQYGKVCHSIFTRNWTSDTSIHQLLSCVYGLMLTPETDDPLDTDLALLYFTEREAYNNAISQHVKKHAFKSKQLWKEDFKDEVSSCVPILCTACHVIHAGKDVKWGVGECFDCKRNVSSSHVWIKGNGQVAHLTENGNSRALCGRCWKDREEKVYDDY